MRVSKAEKALDKQYDALFYAKASGVQFSVLDLGAMRRYYGYKLAAGSQPEAAMADAITKYRKN